MINLKIIKNRKIKIGIDVGTNTGIAVYDIDLKKLILLKTEKQLHRALWLVFKLIKQNFVKIVVFEDARLWKVHKAENWNYGRLLGAGSIKRDSKIWEDFLTDINVNFRKAQPNKKRNALAKNEQLFKQITGWQGRSSEHSRIAGMLIFN